MKFLKMKATRVIAFLTACVLVGVCTFGVSKNYLEKEELYREMPTYTGAFDGMMNQLWAVGVMYLRHIGPDGEFNGSEELKRSTESALQELGLMDSEGNITINDYGIMKYYVSNGEAKLSNTDATFDQLYDENYSYSYDRQQYINIPSEMMMYWHGGSDMSWYSTNYGMEYYYFGYYTDELNGHRGITVYDFDTKGLNSYTDSYGVKIYYKTDGTTPLPFVEDNYDDYNAVPIEIEDDYQPETEDATLPDHGYLIYNAESGQWKHVDSSRFKNIPGENFGLRICITPNADIIADFEKHINDRNTAVDEFVNSIAYFIPIAIVAALLMMYFIIAGGYSISKKRFVTGFFDNIFAEFPILVIVLCHLGGCALTVYPNILSIRSVFKNLYGHPEFTAYFYAISYTALTGTAVLMLNSLIVRLKCHTMIESSLIGRILKKIWNGIRRFSSKIEKAITEREMLKSNLFLRHFIIRTAVAFAVGILLAFVSALMNDVGTLVFGAVIVILAYIWFNLKDMRDLSKLEKQISDMNGGDYSRVELPKSSVAYTITEKLNSISDGMQTAVENRVKSERMKIDLVTNVSHDLKTPLTSIISYIDLLSAEELEPTARDYVKILEQKSQRLSNIVSDLFDLAKATSRTDINAEKIDAVILTGQVLGDMSDKIDRYGREIRTRINADSAPVMADGKKLYRVMQNIIDNALKYSLENTRIWLSLDIEGQCTVIRVKNTASYEMNFTPDEITERFTRGDESRTTEGSGLGLSIAKSFTEACGGSLEVIVDGDTFITQISLPIIK